MPLHQSQVLYNRYRIVKLLGQGGFGAVYRAWDINLKKACAVKENLDTSPEAQRQFAREATILANLSHPNLPRVTDHFSIPGQGQYLVMDYVEGEDIESLLQRQGTVPPDQAIRWVSQVADALKYLHTQQPPVLHRDLKPANIRVTPEGQAMLVDFGLVKVYDPNLRTTLGARAVTPGYSPPEQYGQGKTDPRTDIYALGATLYTMLTGQRPPESVQRMSLDTITSVHQVNVQISPQLSQAVARAMSLNPSQRYRSAAEFQAALTPPTPSISPKPASPPPVQPAFSAPTWVSSRPSASKKRTPWLLWLGGIGAFLIIGFGAILVLGAWYVNNSQTSTATARARQTTNAQAQRTATISVERTARAQMTAEARTRMTTTAVAERTAAAIAEITTTAQALVNYNATLEVSRTLVFGPEYGSLVHEEDDYIEEYTASVDLRDFVAEAIFYNPYSTATGGWDYGFLFRDEGGNEQFRLVIVSDESWVLLNNTGDPDGSVINEGFISNLYTNADDWNHIKLICRGDTGEFYLNDIFIAELDLSARSNSGDILIATGIYTGDEIGGETTDYLDFTVWSLP